MTLFFSRYYRQISLAVACHGLLLASVILLTTNFASAENNLNKQKVLNKKIKSANINLRKSQNISKKLKKDARSYENKLFKLSKKLHNTENKINRLTTKLTKSNKLKQKLLKQTSQQKDALAQQMQALYTSGKQSHLRLLLKQDDPSDISRTVKYFEYLNQHRLKRISQIQVSLEKLNIIQSQIQKDSLTLNTLKEEQSIQKKSLNKVVTEKDKAFKKQYKIVKSQKLLLAKLIKEESQLKRVIEKLALKHRQEIKEKIKLDKQLTDKKKIEKKPTKSKITKHITNRHYVPNKPFSSLKGKLSWPVRGKIENRYGTKRNSKQSWKGVLIAASGGTNVHAVARGKVEFSGRLKGYGYLIIIRHDKNYRSLYAYNRSVFKREGEIVKAGEIIAAVGNSGGQRKTGLYFEIRRGTAYQNPAKWCR